MIRSADELKNKVRQRAAQIVSIDLFDTLVYRTVLEPNDIFRRQFQRAAHLLQGACASADAWTQLRKSSEARLAERAAPGEVQLADIYQDLAEVMHLDARVAHVLQQLELDLERESIRPYADVASALADLHAAGCRIVVCTDTYLPESFIRPLVDSILPFSHELMCSSATQVTKRAGTAYGQMRRQYSGQRIVHFGDNVRVDRQQARRAGVEGHQTLWPRQQWLASHQQATRYARRLGALSLRTPLDADEPARGNPDFADLAWRWSHVLFDFMLDLRRYAGSIEATDIWFLSRDCESMFQALQTAPGFMSGIKVRYVPCSRAAAYPLVAQARPDLFKAWARRTPTQRDLEAGELATAYYRGLIQPQPQSPRVLIVDMGWKGRLQQALSMTLAPQASVFGYYFSMEPKAEQSSRDQSRTFLPWSGQVFNQAVVESLAGFEQASCIGFARHDAGAIEPVLRESTGDCAPAAYCEALRRSLGRMLQEAAAGGAADPQLQACREAAVRSVCAFPDAVVARCFAHWNVGIALDGSDAASLIQGSGISLLQRALGLGGARNAWPQGAIWSVSHHGAIARLLQKLLHARRSWSSRLRAMSTHKSPAPTS